MMKKVLSLSLVFVLLISLLAGCSESGQKGEIKFADAGWDSVKFHNAVAGFIAEEAFGYSWTEVPGSSSILHEGLINGEIDVHMEEWTDTLATYREDVEAGRVQELSVNFDDNQQGVYVPRYVIEGDETRGIEAIAPDLKTVEDLKDYSELFPDQDEAGMGRIYGSIPGWDTDATLHNKFLHYGLDENYIYFRPGSEAALASALTNAYERGEPIVGYYWEPTWLMGKYDFVLLEDEPYEEKAYKEGKTAFPSVEVTVVASNEFVENNPEITEFLKNYETSSELTSQALAHMQDTGDDYESTAKWFLKENDYLLDEWLSEENAQKVREAL